MWTQDIIMHIIDSVKFKVLLHDQKINCVLGVAFLDVGTRFFKALSDFFPTLSYHHLVDIFNVHTGSTL